MHRLKVRCVSPPEREAAAGSQGEGFPARFSPALEQGAVA